MAIVLAEEEGKENQVPKINVSKCPVIAPHVQRIMDTMEKVDKGEIDYFDAMADIQGVLRERREQKLSALEQVDRSRLKVAPRSEESPREEKGEEAAES